MLYSGALAVHAVTMGLALLLLVVREPLLLLGRARPTRLALGAARAVDILTTVGVLAGIALVVIGGWNLLTPWLMLSFALIGGMALVERRFIAPWDSQVRMALKNEVPTVSIPVLVRDRRALMGRLMLIAIFALIVGLMATKPAFL